MLFVNLFFFNLDKMFLASIASVESAVKMESKW